MIRIDVQWEYSRSPLERANDLQVSAYKDAENEKIVMVFINHTESDKKIRPEGLSKHIEAFGLFVTDENKDLVNLFSVF